MSTSTNILTPPPALSKSQEDLAWARTMSDIFRKVKTWTPTITPDSGGVISNLVIQEASYSFANALVFVSLQIGFTISSGLVTSITSSLPRDVFAPLSYPVLSGVAVGYDAVGAGGPWITSAVGYVVGSSTPQLTMYSVNGYGWDTSGGADYSSIAISGFYFVKTTKQSMFS